VLRAEKKKRVSVLRDVLESSKSVILIDFKGMDVEKANLLRAGTKKSGVRYLVVKNTLFKKAIENTKFEGLEKFLTGPTAIAFSEEDSVEPAKVIFDFSKKNEILTFKGGFLENDILDVSDVIELAKLPSKEELIGKTVFIISSSLINFMNVLTNPIRNFLVVLKLLEKQKDSQKTENGG